MGHEVGSHTMTHIDMVRTPEDIMLKELVGSKRHLDELLDDEVTSFAYPYGLHSDTAARLAKGVYKVVRTTHVSSAKGYRLLDEHGCVVAFNLRLSNLYELARLRRLNVLVLYTHLPSITKLSLILTSLETLRPRFLTMSEL